MSSKWAVLGFVELYSFFIGLLFCLLVANLSHNNSFAQKNVYTWLQIIGSIIAVLCLYQYANWVVVGPKNEMLIPYLLPPGSRRVNGVFGQSNLTALMLLLTIIAFLHSYISRKGFRQAFGGFRRDFGLLCVSTAFFLTGSRAGSLSLFTIITVLFLLTLRGKLDCTLISPLRPISILVVGFILAMLPISPEIASSMYTRGEVSVEARFVFWVASLLMFFDSPFVGVGLDHFKLFLPSYARKAHDVLGFVQYESMGYTNWSHNELFQVLAETGMVGFLSMILFGVMLYRIMYKEVFQKLSNTDRSFLYLLLFPFFIQGMFSWPFRHPALLYIFFLILGIIFSNSSHFKFHLKPMVGIFIAILFASSIPGIAYFSFRENRFNQIKKEAKEKGCGSDDIIISMNDPYLKFRVLREILPLCISDQSSLKDSVLLEELKPYFKEISNLQGTYSQWYNLGLIYRNLGEYTQAEHAFQKSVERQPVFELGWSALHALHVEQAARQTGRPIEEFLPPDKKHSVDYYDSIFKRQ
jgi:hypothetical protein